MPEPEQDTVTIGNQTYTVNEFLDITEEQEKKKEITTDLQHTIGNQKHIIKGNLKRRPGNRKINIKYNKKPGRVKMIDKESTEAKYLELLHRTDINKGKDEEKHIYYIVIDTMKKWENIRKNMCSSSVFPEASNEPKNIPLTTQNILRYLKFLYPDHEKIQKFTTSTFSSVILYIWKALKEYELINRVHLGKGKGYSYTLDSKIEKIPVYKLLRITKDVLNEKNKRRNKKTVQQPVHCREGIGSPELAPKLNPNLSEENIIGKVEEFTSETGTLLTLEKSQTTTISIQISPDGTITTNINVDKA